jgi:hypothetical protein
MAGVFTLPRDGFADEGAALDGSARFRLVMFPPRPRATDEFSVEAGKKVRRPTGNPGQRAKKSDFAACRRNASGAAAVSQGSEILLEIHFERRLCTGL